MTLRRGPTIFMELTHRNFGAGSGINSDILGTEKEGSICGGEKVPHVAWGYQSVRTYAGKKQREAYRSTQTTRGRGAGIACLGKGKRCQFVGERQVERNGKKRLCEPLLKSKKVHR